MDKRMVSLALILVIIFIGFTLATENNVLTIMDSSDTFTTDEVKSALDGLKDGMKQWKEYDDITMLFTRFDADYSDAQTELYLTKGRGADNGATQENTIVIKAKFYVDDDHKGAFNPGEMYDWSFTLIREDKNAAWVLDEWGEG